MLSLNDKSAINKIPVIEQRLADLTLSVSNSCGSNSDTTPMFEELEKIIDVLTKKLDNLEKTNGGLEKTIGSNVCVIKVLNDQIKTLRKDLDNQAKELRKDLDNQTKTLRKDLDEIVSNLEEAEEAEEEDSE